MAVAAMVRQKAILEDKARCKANTEKQVEEPGEGGGSLSKQKGKVEGECCMMGGFEC